MSRYSIPPILFMDVNTLWHWRLFDALASITFTLGVSPRSLFEQPRRVEACDQRTIIDAPLLPGWASVTAQICQRYLARDLIARTSMYPQPWAILTTPKYGVLGRCLKQKCRV